MFSVSYSRCLPGLLRISKGKKYEVELNPMMTASGFEKFETFL